MTVRYHLAPPIAELIIDRPAARNALGPDEWRRLADGVAAAARDDQVRVLVVRGEGDHFSAGGDVKTMPERLEQPAAERQARLHADFQIVRALRELPKPVLASIDGSCVGAGLSLALACDLRLASARSRFGAVFHRLGLSGDFGILQLLPRAIGPARALELLLLGDVINAERAERIGLVHRVVLPEELPQATGQLAARLAELPPVAVGLTKAGFERALDHDLATTLAWEAMAQAITSRTDDAHEGLRALAEKRPPRFAGR